MKDYYILKLKYDFFPPIIIPELVSVSAISHHKFIMDGGLNMEVHRSFTKSRLPVEPSLRCKSYRKVIDKVLYYSYSTPDYPIVYNSKNYVGSHVRYSYRPIVYRPDVIDPDYLSRPGLYLPLPLYDGPVTFEDYNNIIRSCICNLCGNRFIYPHIVGVRNSRIHMNDSQCKDCSILRNDRYFNFDYMNLERAYYLGVCYANMQFVYSSSGEVYIKIYGDYELLGGLLKSIGVDKKISGDRSVKEVANSRYCYLLFNQYYYYYDLTELGFIDDSMLLGHPDLPIDLYASFVSGFIRNSETFVRAEFVYIAIESKVMSRMVMDQMRLDGIDCWEEFCNRKMCVVYRKVII